MTQIAHIRNIEGTWTLVRPYTLDPNGKAKGAIKDASGAVLWIGGPEVGMVSDSGADRVVPVVTNTDDTSTTDHKTVTRTTTVAIDGVTIDVVIRDKSASEVRSAFPAITPRQLRLALVESGTPLSTIEAALDGIQDASARALAKIEWDHATQFNRMDPLLLSIAGVVGYTAEEIDALWMWAAGL